MIRDARTTRSLHTRPAPPSVSTSKGPRPWSPRSRWSQANLLLFYTDGSTDAQGADGRRFTLEDISRFIQREVVAEQTTPETLRQHHRVDQAVFRLEIHRAVCVRPTLGTGSAWSSDF